MSLLPATTAIDGRIDLSVTIDFTCITEREREQVVEALSDLYLNAQDRLKYPGHMSVSMTTDISWGKDAFV